MLGYKTLAISLIYFFSQAIVLSFGQEPPTVNTKSGKIQGFSAISYNGAPFNGFMDIPYAIPPVGNLRFTYPQSFGNWTGTRIGNQSGNVCPQINLSTNEVYGDEDCLNLNVYVPQNQTDFLNQKLPVLVYFFGGGLLYGSNRYVEYGPEKYMDFPVILVIPNYRLGALGFLSTNDSSAYGNYGLMDTVEALKWVQNNIQYFGGDPDKVTICGGSVGAETVILHVLSQLSKGLFSRAIASSGSALAYWALASNPLESAQNLSKQVNCPDNTSKDLVDCLRTKTASEIVTAINSTQTSYLFPNPFVPVVEAPGGPGFLTEKPIDIILQNKISNKVPMIIGHTQLEGYTFFSSFKSTFKYNGTEYFQKQFDSQLPWYTPVQPYMTDAVNAIKSYYNISNLDLDNETTFVYVYSEILGDAIISAFTTQAANLLSQAGLPVNAYIYTHAGEMCLASLFNGKCGLYSSQADDLCYQFNYLNFTDSTDTAKQNTKVLDSLWTTFANHSDLYLTPDVKWPFFNTTDPQYAFLNVQPTIGSGPLSNATELWSVTIPELVKKYN